MQLVQSLHGDLEEHVQPPMEALLDVLRPEFGLDCSAYHLRGVHFRPGCRGLTR